MQALKSVAAGVLIGLAAAAAVLIISAPPRGLPIELLPSPTPAPLTVYVSGAVTKPGLYTLPPGSRLSDALTASGGALDGADLTTLNLAQRLIDGQKIQVSLTVETTHGEPPDRAATIDPGIFPLDLNSATQDQLEQLPGIGPSKASDILTYRQKVGGFDKIEQIMEVPGIGPATFEKIKEFIMVAPHN
jgi:competence protein ComEA